MINDLILRVTYDDTIYDLDVDVDVPLRLDMSTVESQEFGKVFGVGSQTFNLPGTSKNNRFFKHAYSVSATDVPAFYNTISCSVLLNGETLLIGRLQLMEVITSDEGYIDYKVQVTDTVLQFQEALNGLLIKNADFSAYNHTFNSASIIDSWDDNLLSGSIFYPLAEYGGQNDTNNLPFATFASGSAFDQSTSRAWDIALHPYEPIQFLPAIKAKDLLTVIFDQVGYRYTGSFTETADFTQAYVLPKGQDALGPVVDPDLVATFEAEENVPQSFGTGVVSSDQVNFTTEISDPQSAYNTVQSHYVCPATGDYIFRADVSFPQPFLGTTDIVTFTLSLNKGVYPSSAAVIDTARITTNILDSGPTISLAVGGKHNLNSGDDVWVTFSKTSGGNAFSFSNAQFACSDAPPSVIDTTLLMNLQFQSDTKSLDILQGFMQQYNLVMVPEEDSSRTIVIETFDDWIGQGEVKDWSQKYNTARRVGINHTVDDLAKETFLKNADDVDRFSKITIDNQPNDQYGTLRLLADNNISQGEDTIGDFFAPVILSGPFQVASTPARDLPESQSFDFDIDVNDNTVFPHLYRFENKQIRSFAFKPRIGYKVTNTVQYPYVIKIGDVDNKSSISGSYATLSNVAALPVISSSTNDLLFNNTYTPYTDVGFNLNNSVSNYERYWKTFYSSLYWENATLVTMDLFFEPYEYQSIKLNDRILVNNIAYRINKIKGFNLTRRDVVTVELLRLYPSYFEATDVVECPKVETYEAQNITSQSMTLSGSVTSIGSGILEKGFVVSTSDTTPTIEEGATKYVVAGVSAGEYDYDLTGLNPGTTYYYQAYVSSSQEACGNPIYNGDSRGNPTLTSSACPAVITVSGSVQGPYKATLFGSTTNTGSGVVERGFVISSTDTSPEIGETNVNKKINATGSAANVVESWSNIITGSIDTWLSCSTDYNFRAYASSSECLEYGTNLTFTTEACPTGSTPSDTGSCIPFSASLETIFNGACSETIAQVLHTDYTGSWPPTQGYLDGGGVMHVYMDSSCSVASPNTYYAFDSSSTTGTDVNSFLRVNDAVGDNPGDVIYIYNCEGP
jgi:hypothetical protein